MSQKRCASYDILDYHSWVLSFGMLRLNRRGYVCIPEDRNHENVSLLQ
jgi:hypothetical protein